MNGVPGVMALESHATFSCFCSSVSSRPIAAYSVRNGWHRNKHTYIPRAIKTPSALPPSPLLLEQLGTVEIVVDSFLREERHHLYCLQ